MFQPHRHIEQIETKVSNYVLYVPMWFKKVFVFMVVKFVYELCYDSKHNPLSVVISI